MDIFFEGGVENTSTSTTLNIPIPAAGIPAGRRVVIHLLIQHGSRTVSSVSGAGTVNADWTVGSYHALYTSTSLTNARVVTIVLTTLVALTGGANLTVTLSGTAVMQARLYSGYFDVAFTDSVENHHTSSQPNNSAFAIIVGMADTAGLDSGASTWLILSAYRAGTISYRPTEPAVNPGTHLGADPVGVIEPGATFTGLRAHVSRRAKGRSFGLHANGSNNLVMSFTGTFASANSHAAITVVRMQLISRDPGQTKAAVSKIQGYAMLSLGSEPSGTQDVDKSTIYSVAGMGSTTPLSAQQVDKAIAYAIAGMGAAPVTLSQSTDKSTVYAVAGMGASEVFAQYVDKSVAYTIVGMMPNDVQSVRKAVAYAVAGMMPDNVQVTLKTTAYVVTSMDVSLRLTQPDSTLLGPTVPTWRLDQTYPRIQMNDGRLTLLPATTGNFVLVALLSDDTIYSVSLSLVAFEAKTIPITASFNQIALLETDNVSSILLESIAKRMRIRRVLSTEV